jgi:hypothetical protein
MDVRLPDGTVIKGVPDDMSKADLTAKLKSNGYDVSKLEAPATPAPSSGIPAARQDLTMGQKIYQDVRPFAAPLVEAGGAIIGGVLGGTAGTFGAGPVGTAAGGVFGAGLGYGIAKEGLEAVDVAMGMKAPRTGAALVTEPVRNILEGSTYEAGGRVLGQGLGYALGKVADVRNVPKNKAAEIARNALGPDLPEVLNALKASQGQNVSAAQATSNINSPTWQALLDRVSKRDPRFLAALEKSQGDVSLNALAKLAGGTTATEIRAGAETTKANINRVLEPVKESALKRANLGQSTQQYATEAERLAAEAAAKVQDVRRFTAAGPRAEALARTQLIEKGQPVGAAKYTYVGGDLPKLAERASAEAASGSLQTGAESRFAQLASDALRKSGIKPLETESLVGSLSSVARNPEFAGNDIVEGALNNVARDISKWAKDGIIDAQALDAIRKNSVNAAIEQLRPGVDATTQKNLAASVLDKVRPAIINAIENAGGTGYREYLGNYGKAMQGIAEKKLGGEALNLYKTNPDAFVKLVQGESPEVVEKILGSGKYNIATELADSTMSTLKTEADKVIRNAKIDTQVAGGQDALKRLLLENLSMWRLPSYITAVASTTNKALSILENKIGNKTMTLLADASKTPKGAAALLETLPAVERNRVIALIADPSTWSKRAAVGTLANSGAAKGAQQAAEAIRTGSMFGSVNALTPDSYNRNALPPRLQASGMTTANPTGQFTQ